jgi:hypothetical protein
MSPEMDVLDQLQGSDLALRTIRLIFPDDARFNQALLGLLQCGDVRLVAPDGCEVAAWRWREIFSVPELAGDDEALIVQLTDQGAERIG